MARPDWRRTMSEMAEAIPYSTMSACWSGLPFDLTVRGFVDSLEALVVKPILVPHVRDALRVRQEAGLLGEAPEQTYDLLWLEAWPSLVRGGTPGKHLGRLLCEPMIAAFRREMVSAALGGEETGPYSAAQLGGFMDWEALAEGRGRALGRFAHVLRNGTTQMRHGGAREVTEDGIEARIGFTDWRPVVAMRSPSQIRFRPVDLSAPVALIPVEAGTAREEHAAAFH